MTRAGTPSFHVATVSNIFGCASDRRALQTFGEVLELRREGCDFNRLPVYASDFVGLHHLLYVSADGGRPQLAGGGTGVLLSECDAVGIPFPALEGMREVKAEALLSLVSRMVAEHRAASSPLGYAGGYTLLKPFRRDRAVLGSLVELVAALVADDFITRRVGRLLAFGIVGRSTRLIRRLGFSALADAEEIAFPSPYIPGAFASFFEMTEPSRWARECRARWAPVLRERSAPAGPASCGAAGLHRLPRQSLEP
jgi:hypothetical protein